LGAARRFTGTGEAGDPGDRIDNAGFSSIGAAGKGNLGFTRALAVGIMKRARGVKEESELSAEDIARAEDVYAPLMEETGCLIGLAIGGTIGYLIARGIFVALHIAQKALTKRAPPEATLLQKIIFRHTVQGILLLLIRHCVMHPH